MSRALALLVVATGLAVALVWAGYGSSPHSKPADAALQPAPPQQVPSTVVVPEPRAERVDSGDTAQAVAAPASPLWIDSPSLREQIARAPKDGTGFPREQRLFMHKMLLMNEDGHRKRMDGRLSSLKFNVDRFLHGLPEPFATQARERDKELRSHFANGLIATKAQATWTKARYISE